MKKLGTLKVKVKINTDNIDDVMSSIDSNFEFKNCVKRVVELYVDDEYNHFDKHFLTHLFKSVNESVWVEDVISFEAKFEIDNVPCKVIVDEGKLKIAEATTIYKEFKEIV